MYRLGIDTGGTNTDVVLTNVDTGRMYYAKTPTTPKALLNGIMNGIEKIVKISGIRNDEIDELVYGTEWSIVTPAASGLVVYDVAPLPEITAQDAVVEGNQVSVELSGSQLEKFTDLNEPGFEFRFFLSQFFQHHHFFKLSSFHISSKSRWIWPRQAPHAPPALQ